MKRILTISGEVGAFDVPTFSTTENDHLTIKVNVKEKFLGYYLLKVRREQGNAKELTFGFKAGTEKAIDLPLDWLKDGYGAIDFSLVLRDSLNTITYKDNYKIPSLRYKETPQGNYNYSDTVHTLTYKVEELLQRVKILETKLKEFENEGVPLVFE